MKPISIVCVFFLLLSACKPTEPEVTVTQVTSYDLKIVNNIGVPLHLFFYKTEADYLMARDHVCSYDLEGPFASCTVHNDNLQDGYYMDWYSGDYNFTNWGTVRLNDKNFDDAV